MNMIEDQKHNHIPSLGKKKTKIIMKKFPQKVLDNFDMYHGSLDLSVFVKYLPKSEIKTFLCKATQYTFNNMDTWRYFLNNMEQEERFKFVKKTLIDKNDFKILFAKDKQSFLEGINTYQWYEFLPFDVAFSELKNLIRKQNVPAKRFSILIVLISCARKSPEHIKSLLKYCYEQHINEPYKYKIQFVNALLSSVSAHEFDVETWNYLNQLFHSMEVYIESNNDVRQCLEAIILYNVLHDKPVPEIVEQKQSFNTFRNIKNRLNDEQKNKLFTYLLNSAWSKIKTENIENESILDVTLNELKNVLMLLKDWNKTYNDYPFILEKIQELMKIKEENKWTTDMSCLYNVNKSWRKYMFEESLSLSLSEETCLNALKHKPQLLTRHDKQIHTLRTDDAVSLRRVLAKLRVYWPDSLAPHWTEAYMQSLNELTGQKAVIKGLFRLSPVNQVIELGMKHVPIGFKINWSESNQAEISLQKNIAKHLHVARPPVPLDTVLSYAKGDYLQYAVPSLNTILLNLSEIESREYLPKLLDAPVSLQKFGIRQAFLKFEINDLITIVSNIWNTTKNPSIRSIIFLCTYDKICKIKNQFKEKCLWKLLSLFLDDKTFEKSVGIYKKLIDVDTIPSSLQGEFFMKGYNILSSSPHSDKEWYLNQLLQCTTRVMERLDEDFVADKLLSPAGTKLCSYDSQYINSFACYVLCGNSQENQLLRFNRVLRPAMEEAFQRWDDNNSGSLYVKSQFERLLEYLGWYFIVYLSLNKIPVPTKLFAEILKTLQKGLPEVKNYVLITSWKFVTEYIQLIEEHETVLNAFKLSLSNFTISDFVESTDYVYMGEEPEKDWQNNHKKLSPFLGPKIVLFLEKDCEKYGPTIYNLFGSALKNMFKMLTFTSDSYIVDTLKYMLVDENFVASYLLVSLCLPQHCSSSLKSEALELRITMALMLEGETLGKKRRHFNKLVADAVASKHYELTPIGDTDSDIDNLLKIEIACKARNVDYVIEVMKSKDMLYAATAIKKSTWLITDPQYAHIINPEYLHTQLKPYMTTKAFNKLMLHVRLNLKDESRVEAFYEHFKDTDSGCKWLQNCSIPFIENVMKSERPVPVWLFKRLCKRSSRFLSYNHKITNIKPYSRSLQAVLFMLKSQTDHILNMIEDKSRKGFCKIGKHKTEFLMKKYPRRVIEQFEIYGNFVDMSVVAKYIKEEEMQSFLHKHANYLAFKIHNCESWGYFINRIPIQERFEFVKNTFIDKSNTGVALTEEVRTKIEFNVKTYQWYEFAPFDIAFTELKKLIRKESQPADRHDILLVLISCGSKKSPHIKTLLKYLNEKHMNEPFKFKIKFICKLLFSTAVHEYDIDTWNYLDQFFYSMEVYTETEKCVEACRAYIILYKVLHDEPVPDIITTQVSVESFRNIQKTLNAQQKSKLFTYLLNTLWAQTNRASCVTNESDFRKTILQMSRVITLVKSWKQEITCYRFILERIQELIKIKEDNKWTTDMSCLYNVNKSTCLRSRCRSLCPRKRAPERFLSNKPQLLTRHDKQIHTLRTDDAVSLRRVLAKLRVYWPDSLAPHWTEAYMQSLNKPTGQKAIINGIFLLSPIDQVVQLAKKHVPSDTKINWSDSNQAEISIQRNIAKHLHVARPLVPLDTVLWYAKGDYLQYAVPSLSAVLSNVSEVESREYLPKLLDAPVSLQKFGLRLTYTKFEASEIKHVFSDIWKITKNATIRAVIFEQTFNQLCSSKNQNIENELWELLSLFMQDLNSQESSSLYKILSKVKSVPISLRGKYYMKSYEILKSLPESHNCVSYLKKNIAYATHVMELLDEDFVVNKLLSPVESTFCKHNEMYLDVFACFLLCGESEENQLQRFRRIEKAIDEAFQRWHDIHLNCFYVKMLFDNFLKSLVKNFEEYFVRNKTPIPVKLFQEIQSKIQKELPLVENYVLFTVWSLVTEYVKCMKEHASNISNILKSSTSENVWKDIHLEVSPSFGKKVIGYLKEDTEKYSSAIHDLFTEALNRMLYIFNFEDVKLVALSHMLYDREFIPSYLVVCKCMPVLCLENDETKDDEKSKRFEILNQIKSHPSPLVGLYYHHHFNIRPQYL
ncbi:hypothetical protein SFRURICE_009440 [Spodoptera frugiperda]|nr:hypothetical protein SFRURICE_009440 [Spodoptera frugiperda]